MNIDRKMVNLFLYIRKNVPPEIRQGMKLSSPTLESDLVAVFNIIDNYKVKAAITEFFKRSGTARSWLPQADNSKKQTNLANNLSENLRYYRGALVEKLVF